MKVCIAEKPSVAREIANIIGANSRKDGYFEGNGYCVTWTFGHFCTLKDPMDYNASWKRWDLNTLPMVPPKFETKLMSNSGVKKQFAVIKKLMKTAELVINCGDAGQEGELIQRWVLKEAKYKGKVLRLWISSLTPEAIRDGFQNLKNGSDFDNLYYAGSSRAIGDWVLGINATRLYTLKHGGFKQVLSVGRVQTPTLAMLVERRKEIEKFVPKPYWELHTIYREIDFHYEKGRFQKQEDGQGLLQKVTDKDFTVLSSDRKKGKELPPSLFDLTSLQVHCNKRFGYSADQTLKLVQKLYEQKVVTYPRVDTTYLPNDVYPKIPGILKKMGQYSQFTPTILGGKIRKSSKVFNDKKVTDHHAIIPTGYEKNLQKDEHNVYDAIARRFIAAFYPDCIFARTTVIGEVEGIKFKATGKEILEEGWRVLFPKKASKPSGAKPGDKVKEEDVLMPNFVPGESGPHDPSLVEKMTQPPKHYTEATLLRAMETAGKKVDDESLRELMKENGIGRPSTRANIIETLFRRKYIERKKKLIIATDVGLNLIDIIENKLLTSAELTGQWEKQLRDIEDGQFSAKQFIGNMKNMVEDLVHAVRLSNNNKKLAAPQSPGPKSKSRGIKKSNAPKSKTAKKGLTELTCPKCKSGNLIKGNSAYGCSAWKSGCKFRLPFAFKNKKISETQLVRLVAKSSTVNMKGFEHEGKKVEGKIIFDKDYNLVFASKSNGISKPTTSKPKANTASDISCPKCKKGKVIKGKTAYGCTNWKAGCDFRFAFDEIRKKANGQKLTKDLVVKIIGSA